METIIWTTIFVVIAVAIIIFAIVIRKSFDENEKHCAAILEKSWEYNNYDKTVITYTDGSKVRLEGNHLEGITNYLNINFKYYAICEQGTTSYIVTLNKVKTVSYLPPKPIQE